MLWLRETEKVQKNADYRLCGLCKNVKRNRCEAAAQPHLQPAFRHSLASLGYAGKHALNKIVMHAYPSLEKKKLYNREKARAAQHGGVAALRQAKTEYLLQGKAHCGMCGAPVAGACKKGEGGACLNCACNSKDKTHLCKKHDDKKDFIEWYVVEQVIEHILTPSRIKLLAMAMANADEKRHSLDATFTPARLANEAQPKIDRRATPASSSDAAALRTQEIAAYLKRFCKGNLMDAEFRRRIIDAFVDHVYLYDDRVVIFCSLRKDKPTLRMQACDIRKESTAEDARHFMNNNLVYFSRTSQNERHMYLPLVSKPHSHPFTLQLSYAA